MKQPVRRKAARRKKRPNQPTARRGQRACFSDLAGRWTPDPAFDEIVAAQRTIDWDKWK